MTQQELETYLVFFLEDGDNITFGSLRFAVIASTVGGQFWWVRNDAGFPITVRLSEIVISEED